MLYMFLKYLFMFIYRIFFRARVIGTENFPKEGPVILAANHMSNADPPLVGCFAPRHVHFMAKKELFEMPVLRFVLPHCYSFPVRRGAADREAIKTAVKTVRSGHCLGLFPEGTRSRTGKMRRAEAGVGLIAAMTRAPLIPTAIIGTNRIFSRECFLPKITVIYGKPMYFEGDHKDKAALEAFSQSILEEIARLEKPYL